MSLEVSRTVKKCMLPDGRALRLSKTVEDVYFIFLEPDYGRSHDKRKMLWNGVYETDANVHFRGFKCEYGALTEGGQDGTT